MYHFSWHAIDTTATIGHLRMKTMPYFDWVWMKSVITSKGEQSRKEWRTVTLLVVLRFDRHPMCFGTFFLTHSIVHALTAKRIAHIGHIIGVVINFNLWPHTVFTCSIYSVLFRVRKLGDIYAIIFTSKVQCKLVERRKLMAFKSC